MLLVVPKFLYFLMKFCNQQMSDQSPNKTLNIILVTIFVLSQEN